MYVLCHSIRCQKCLHSTPSLLSFQLTIVVRPEGTNTNDYASYCNAFLSSKIVDNFHTNILFVNNVCFSKVRQEKQFSRFAFLIFINTQYRPPIRLAFFIKILDTFCIVYVKIRHLNGNEILIEYRIYDKTELNCAPSPCTVN